MRRLSRFGQAALAFGLLAALPSAASAHAVIVDSKPAPGAEIAASDADVALRYNSRIDRRRSRLTLVGENGDARPLPILPDSAADVIDARLPELAPGQYRLRWQVLAVDGHLTRGDIPFRIKTP